MAAHGGGAGGLTLTLNPRPQAHGPNPNPNANPSLTQAAAQEAARLDLSTDEIGQFFHARMLQSLGRYR